MMQGISAGSLCVNLLLKQLAVLAYSSSLSKFARGIVVHSRRDNVMQKDDEEVPAWQRNPSIGVGGREMIPRIEQGKTEPQNKEYRQTSGGLVLLQERICPRLSSAHDRLFVSLITHLLREIQEIVMSTKTSSVETSHPPHSSPKNRKPLPSSSLSESIFQMALKTVIREILGGKVRRQQQAIRSVGCREMDGAFSENRGWVVGS